MNEYSYSEQHMGTEATISLVCNTSRTAEAVATNAFKTIHQYELEFSRFLPHSALSKLNSQKQLSVSKEFLQIFLKSAHLSRLTNGAFNPLSQVVRLGYQDTFSALKDQVKHLDQSPYDTDLNHITIDEEHNHIVLGPQQQLDFGGILKGYLAHQLADHIQSMHPECTGVIVNIGGDLATRGYDEVHKPFIFMLYNPVTGTETPVPVTNKSLATSGTYHRTWLTDSGRQHHIIDPEDQQNSHTDLVSVTIIHKDGAHSEALTKLFLVQGVTQALTCVPPDNYQYFAVSATGDVISNIV